MRSPGDSWNVYVRNLSDRVKALLKANVATLDRLVADANFDDKLLKKADLGLAPADYGNIPAILNGKTLQELRTDSDNLATVQGNLTNSQNTITTAQTQLGITNLNILPNMRGKTVPQLLTDQQTIAGTGKALNQLIADST